MRKRGTARRPWVGPGLAGGTRPHGWDQASHLGLGLTWGQASVGTRPHGWDWAADVMVAMLAKGLCF